MMLVMITTESGKAFILTRVLSKLNSCRDLSDNNFTGSVPEFLSELPNLRVL